MTPSRSQRWIVLNGLSAGNLTLVSYVAGGGTCHYTTEITYETADIWWKLAKSLDLLRVEFRSELTERFDSPGPRHTRRTP